MVLNESKTILETVLVSHIFIEWVKVQIFEIIDLQNEHYNGIHILHIYFSYVESIYLTGDRFKSYKNQIEYRFSLLDTYMAIDINMPAM